MTERAQGIATCTPLRSKTPCSSRRLRYSMSPALPAATHAANRSASTRSSSLESASPIGATPAVTKPASAACSRSQSSSSRVHSPVAKMLHPTARTLCALYGYLQNKSMRSAGIEEAAVHLMAPALNWHSPPQPNLGRPNG